MSGILLDTHVLLWFLDPQQKGKLSDAALRELEDNEDAAFSIASLWEIGIKLGLDKPGFQLQDGWWKTIPETLLAQGFKRIDITPDDCRAAAELELHHRDPFDRMLIAQAKNRSLSIVTADSKFAPYGVEVIW